MVDVLPDSFTDLLRLWRVDPIGTTETLIEAAEEVQVAPGALQGAVAALVSDGPDASRSAFERLVSAVEQAAGLASLEGTEAQDAAVAASGRRYLAGQVTARELTYWVTRVVGLRGGVRTQVFLDLEQDYCARLGESDVSDLDDRVAVAAERFLAVAVGEEPAQESGLRRLFTRRKRSAPSPRG